MYISFPLSVVPKSYTVTKVLLSKVADISTGFTVEGYDGGIVIEGLTGYKNNTGDVHVTLTY